jgi:hypothetical protein
MDTLLPIQASEANEKLLPQAASFSTEIEDPTLPKLKSDIVEPNRAKALTDERLLPSALLSEI